MFSRLSLRMRLTVFTAFVILIVCILLTISANFSANRLFVQMVPLAPAETSDKELNFDKTIKNDDTDLDTNLSEPKIEDASMISTMTNSHFSFTSKVGADILSNEISEQDSISPAITMAIATQKHLFSISSVFFMALGIFFGSVAMWFMAGRILKPIHNLQKKIDNIQVNNLSERLVLPKNMDELGKLSVSFNCMMDKIDVAFENQKRFAANAAHELKTPLTVMETNLEVLDIDDNPPPEQISKALTALKNNTERMTDLLNNLFLMSANKDYDKTDTIVFTEMIQSIFMELQSIADSRNILFHLYETPIQFIGNYEMLYRVFYNVIENCVKYNRDGGSVFVSAEETDLECVFKISDTGIGIQEEEQASIFEPFYRVDKSRSRAIGGSGLGLALVKAILKAHKGNIDLESQYGIGSTFTIILPKAIYKNS